MINPTPQRLTHGGLQYNYLQFDHASSLKMFVTAELQRLSQENLIVLKGLRKDTVDKIKNGSKWYGEPVPLGLAELENHELYIGMHLVKVVSSEIKEHLKRYLNLIEQNLLPKPRLAYNDRRIGVFSFDRASIGLFKQYHSNNSLPIDQVLTQFQIELSKPDIKTSTKKVYAFFQNKNISYPSVRIFLLAGGNCNVAGNSMLYVGLACSELAEFFEARGIAVEVSLLIGTQFNYQACFSIIRLKRFQDKMDKNKLLVMSSDPRYYRYQGFKALIAQSNYFGLTIPESLGRIEASMGKAFVAALNLNGFVFEQSYSLESVSKEVMRIIEEYYEQNKRRKSA